MYSLSMKAICRLAVAMVACLVAASPALAQNGPAPTGQKPASDAKKDQDKGQAGNPAANAGQPAGQASPAATNDGAPADGTSPAANNGTGQAAGSDSAETLPTNLRLRQLEQRVQALKERTWRAKARVGMLKEAVLGGGVGATATIVHKNQMGSSFRLIKLDYALDGTPIFSRSDDTGALHKEKDLDILTGPIAPGSHTISVVALYRGHGYGVFKYLTKYKFKVRSSHTFTASDGKSTRIEAVGFERGGPTTPLEDRPAIDFKVIHSKGTLGN